MQVVADTSVFNYLLLLGQLPLLPTLYGQIIAPPVVLEVELPHPHSPVLVRAWAQQLTGRPAWLVLRAPTRTPEADLLLLEAGERDTILVAQELHADLVLMDDKDGRKAAELRALTVYGTLGVLVRATELRLIDLQAVFTRLLTTSFRIDERILRDALARDAARKAAAPPAEPQEP